MPTNCSIRLITAKDIMYILGLGERQARRIIQKIRKGLGKVAGQRVTLEEFCSSVGLQAEVVRAALGA